MKKVLFLARLFHPHKGGVETHVLNLSKELVKKGYEVTVLTEQYDPELPLSETLQSMKVVRIPYGYGHDKYRLWMWIWQHPNLFTEADIVHVHDVFWWIIPVVIFIRKKYFITFHGWEGKFPISKTAIWQRQLAAKLAKGVIQVGAYIGRWYQTKADVTLYGAVDENILKVDKSTKKLQYEFAFMGRLDADNDLPKALEFFQLIKTKKPSTKFIFIGDGVLRKDCEQVGIVTGFVDHPEKYLVQAKYVCASSYLSIMESQALRKTVFSFYSNPLKKDYLELYPQAKAMVIEDDPQKALIKWQHSPKNTSQSWARTQTWEKVAEEYNRLWKKV